MNFKYPPLVEKLAPETVRVVSAVVEAVIEGGDTLLIEGAAASADGIGHTKIDTGKRQNSMAIIFRFIFNTPLKVTVVGLCLRQCNLKRQNK